MPGVVDFSPEFITSHLRPYFANNGVVRIRRGVEVVEDDVKEFWDRADALNDGLVHGEGVEQRQATGREDEGMGCGT